MAKVYSYTGESAWPAIIEDPRPGNDGFFIYGHRHDKQSLTPQFNSKLNFDVSGGISDSSYSAYAATSYYQRKHLMLQKMTVHAPPHYSQSKTYSYNIIEDTAWCFIDDTEFNQQGIQVISDESNSQETRAKQNERNEILAQGRISQRDPVRVKFRKLIVLRFGL